MAKKVKSSEVHAYIFIKETLSRIGWSVKNPLKSPNGQVYTQQECLGNERMAEQLSLLRNAQDRAVTIYRASAKWCYTTLFVVVSMSENGLYEQTDK